MVKRQWALWAAILVLGPGIACNRGSRCNEETARQGVIEYLAKRANLNVAGMNVTVTSLACREKDADASVAFTAKGANPGQPMSFRYTLERQGDRWVVKDKAETGGSPHGAGAASAQPGAAMPPGHPPVGGDAPKP